MKKKIISILLCTIIVLSLVGCGNTTSKETTNSTTNTAKASNATDKKETKEEIKKEAKEINKDEYEKADFAKLNTSDEKYIKMTGTKVYVEGEASAIDLKGGVFDKSPNLTVTQNENGGYGMYVVKGYSIKDANIVIKKKDNVRVYGIIYHERISSLPTILVEKIEKV